jgi:hypothetical protein
MPETTPATEAQAAEVAPPQEGTSPAQVAVPVLDPAALQRELAEARREAARYRTDLRKVTDAQLTESERLQRRVTELEAERAESAARDRERAIRLAALEAAAKLGFRDPDLAVRLVDPAAVEVSDDGTPKNVERLLTDVLTRSPYLARPGTSADFGGGVRGSAPAGTDMNRLIRRAAGRT